MAGSESGWVDICYGWVEMGGDGIYFLNIFYGQLRMCGHFMGGWRWVDIFLGGWGGVGGIFWMGAGKWG